MGTESTDGPESTDGSGIDFMIDFTKTLGPSRVGSYELSRRVRIAVRQFCSRRARIAFSAIWILLGTIAQCHGQTPALQCRDDITESMQYMVREVRVQGRWVPPELIEKVKGIVKIGEVYSPTVLALAQTAVREELEKKENRSLEFTQVGAVSVLEVDSCVLDVSDSEHPKQVDIVINPHYLRVDLYDVGSNTLPIPRSIEPTFYENVPRLLRALNPRPGALYDRRYGFSPTLLTSHLLLRPSGSNSEHGGPVSSTRLELITEGRKSVNHSFYDVDARLKLSRPRLHQKSGTGWSLAVGYSGHDRPLGEGSSRQQGLGLTGSIQLNPRNRFVDAAVIGGGLRRSRNRFDASGLRGVNTPETAVELRVLGDKRVGAGFTRTAFWAENGSIGSGGSYQRIAGMIGFARQFGKAHQTIDVEVVGGGGRGWGNLPEYARFYGGSPERNFLYDSPGSTALELFPVGPIIRSFGQSEAGVRDAAGATRGGTSYGHLNFNVAFPVRGWSRPLVPDVPVGNSDLRTKLKGSINTAQSAIVDDLIGQGLPDNAETAAVADAIMDREIRPTVNFLADRANVYALKPLLLCDVAKIGGINSAANQTRVAIGGGLQFTVVTAKLEAGYMYSVRRAAGDPRGNIFLRLAIQNLF